MAYRSWATAPGAMTYPKFRLSGEEREELLAVGSSGPQVLKPDELRGRMNDPGFGAQPS
jgi:hypothetical protein